MCFFGQRNLYKYKERLYLSHINTKKKKCLSWFIFKKLSNKFKIKKYLHYFICILLIFWGGGFTFREKLQTTESSHILQTQVSLLLTYYISII